jgi:hypothetical protein
MIEEISSNNQAFSFSRLFLNKILGQHDKNTIKESAIRYRLFKNQTIFSVR